MKKFYLISLLCFIIYNIKAGDFIADITNSCSPAIITFTETGNGVKWVWDFGDGFTASNINPVTHPYLSEGVYTITCRVTYSDGHKEIITKQNYIKVTDFKASFLASDTVLCSPGGSITFTGTGCEMVNYKWDFGDGTQAEGMTVNHIYHQPGKYTITTIAYCDCKRIDTLIKTDAIWVFDSLSPEVQIYDSIIYNPNATVIFMNNTHKNIACDYGLSDVIWDFGDNSPNIHGDSVSHCYGKYGTFFITAWFNSFFGCPQTIYNQTLQILKGNSISEIDQENSVQIFPNPAKNTIHITSMDLTINYIKVIDLQGKVLIHSFDVADIDIQDLANGIYYLQVVTPNNNITKKFIKN